MSVLGRREDLPMRPGRFYCPKCEPESRPSFPWLGEGHLATRFWTEASPSRGRDVLVPRLNGAAAKRVYELMSGSRGWLIRRPRDAAGSFATCANCGCDRLYEVVYGRVDVVVKDEEMLA